MIFASSQNSKYDSDFYLRGDPVSLIITNIPSFKGGRSNPWADADNNITGLRGKQGETVRPDEFDNVFKEQSISDGLLEISVAPTLRNLVLDQTRRIGQAEGPFDIRINASDSEDTVHFIQLDGEFMKIKNLQMLTFRLATMLPEGSLRMLERIDTSRD